MGFGMALPNHFIVHIPTNAHISAAVDAANVEHAKHATMSEEEKQ